MSYTIQVRRDTKANLTSVNPVLHQGEAALETDTGKAKIGNGVTAWTSLGYSLGLLTAPTVTVSPVGLGGGALVANNGADYGPDTAGTVTSGIQEAVNAAVTAALAGATRDVVLLPGKFTLSQFSNLTYRAAVVIDAGYAASAGPPITITIRGSGYGMVGPEGSSTFAPPYAVGATVIDASALDVLGQGLYKQGRVFLVPPRATNYGGGLIPTNAVFLRMESMIIIVPAYNAAGTGSPAYNLGGTSSALFVSGNTQSANTTHWEFVNGVDAWGAAAFKVKDVGVISGLAAYNPTGDIWTGGGGVLAYGSAAGFVFPEASNFANVYFETIATYDLHISAMVATHTAGTQLYAQASSHVLYFRQAGHGVHLGRILGQSQSVFIQHALLTKLTNSLAGAYFDPVGDLYTPIGMTFPSAAGSGSISFDEISVEAAMTTFLVDDASNPVTLIAHHVDHTGSIAASAWGAGANMMINMVDAPSSSLTALSGTTAGTVTYSQTGNTPWAKKFSAYLAGYENTTGTAQTITFLVPYNHVPAILKDDSGGVTVTATTLTLPVSMGAPVTGYIILEGY